MSADFPGSCPLCAGTTRILVVPVTAGKMTRLDNCPRCNRNGRRKPALVSADGRRLHWEHGYRCHGLWTDTNRRLGVVGIGPRGIWKPVDGYSWQIDSPRREGEAGSLRDAKRRVEEIAVTLRVGPAGS
jgi:hypothetical protein